MTDIKQKAFKLANEVGEMETQNQVMKTAINEIMTICDKYSNNMSKDIMQVIDLVAVISPEVKKAGEKGVMKDD